MKISTTNTTPDGTELETLLALATTEPGRRPAFYRKLLESDVLVMVPDEVVVPNAQGDAVMRFVQWNRIDRLTAIPFFSSARTFFEAIPQGAQCLVVDGLQLLLLTRGAMLHLNPFSEHNVVLMPEDVELLLASGTLGSSERIKHTTERQLTTRDLSEPPAAMIEALTVLYSQAPNVKAAYLALVNGLYDSGQDSLLLGLEVDGDPEPIVNDTSAVIHDTYRDAYSIDIVEVWVDDEGNPTSTFLPAQRFFDRRMASALSAPTTPKSLC